MKMRRLPLLLFPLLLLCSPGQARADMSSATTKFEHGDYQAAIKDFRRIRGRDANKAKVQLARVLMRVGDLAGAEKIVKPLARRRKVGADASALLGEIYLRTGRYGLGKKVLEAATNKHPKHLRVRYQLGRTYHRIGKDRQAKLLFDEFFDDFNNGKIDPKNAEQLMYVALAARYLQSFQDANSTFRDALDVGPKLSEANIEWGNTFLMKYNAADGEQSFDDVLKLDPNHPDAHAGLARVKLLQSYDVRASMKHIEKALSVDPHHAGALLIRAEIELDNEQYADSEKTVDDLLAVNPKNLDALASKAASRWLQDDKKGYNALRRQALSINPRFAGFFHRIAEFAVKRHRYQEVIALEEEAIKIDPNFHLARAGIGAGYMRLGEEKKGLEHLNQAHDDDPFNVRTYNVLSLYDRIPNIYVDVNTKHFRLRVAKGERAILRRYIPQMLERARKDMVKRYGFSPSSPVSVEIYADPGDYSVRTIGLPNLGALGVCFGKVITTISPYNGNLNWSMILWHELGHVFALQLSKSRVPRWFTEGLSEYETIIARPEWRRENDVDVWMAMQAGKLPSVVELNTMFSRARNMQEMVVAYHLSSIAVKYIADRWGFPKIVEALKAFGKGKDTAQMLKQITGQDVATFDAEFRLHLEKRLAVYKGSFKVSLANFSDLTELEKEVAARPQDADAHADVAIAYVVAQKLTRAQISVQAALKIDDANKKALFADAEIHLLRRRAADAKKALGKLIAAGGDGYGARSRLAQLAVQAGDIDEAKVQFDRAKKLDPERGEPYAAMAEMYFKKHRDAEGLKELERYVYIEQMDVRPLKTLIDKYALRKQYKKVVTYGQLALRIAPHDAELHMTLGNAYLKVRKPKAALWELDSALIAEPGLRRPAVAHLGLAKAYRALRKIKRARAAVAAALHLEPRNAEALALKAKLGGKPRRRRRGR